MVTFGTKVSLGAALALAEKKESFLTLEQVEAQLPELLLEARGLARERSQAQLAARGLDPARNRPSEETLSVLARGLLLSAVEPGSQAALSRLLYAK